MLDGAGITRTRDILDYSLQILMDSQLLIFHLGLPMLRAPEGKKLIIAYCLLNSATVVPTQSHPFRAPSWTLDLRTTPDQAVF